MKKISSAVWKFFERITDEAGKCTMVVCKLCELQYKYFGNTTNLRVHLMKKHPVQWELSEDSSFQIEGASPGTQNTSTTRKRQSRGRTEKNVDQNSDSDDEATINLVRQMHGDQHSEEEWLEEDPYQITHIETYEPQPKRKRKFRKIKREIPSPTGLPGFYAAPKPEKVVYEEHSKDEYSVFGEYVANKLRKIKTPRTRGNLQQLITTILWQAEYGLYDNADAVKRVLLMNLHTETEYEVQPVQNEVQVVTEEVQALVNSPDPNQSGDSLSVLNN